MIFRFIASWVMYKFCYLDNPFKSWSQPNLGLQRKVSKVFSAITQKLLLWGM